jgi:hypothetical protein
MSRSAPPAAASSVRTGDGGLRSIVGSAEGGFPEPAATTLAPDEDLLGPGTAGFVAGGGLLLPETVDFAPPRALFTLRPGSPTLVNARRFRVASWRSLSIICRYNSNNIPSVRKNLHLTGQTRRKYVLAGRPGDRNVPWPSTPAFAPKTPGARAKTSFPRGTHKSPLTPQQNDRRPPTPQL